MSLFQKKNGTYAIAVLCALAFAPLNSVQAQVLPTFAEEGKDNPRFLTPNQRMVVLPTGLAAITAQRYLLPKDTFTYPLANMTIFPYYQASPELKEFLNSRVYGTGLPITSFNPTPNYPTVSLPPTDLVRRSIPIPTMRQDTRSSSQLAIRDGKYEQGHWVVAHQQGQSFGVPGDRDAVVIVSPGTMFNACGERTLALRCGTMWVLTGERQCSVLTKYGSVEVRPFSIAAVEQTWFNRVRAADLYGHPLHLQFAFKGNISKATVEKGKELSITENAVASSGSSDYVEAPKDGTQLASKPTMSPAAPSNLNLTSKKVDPDVSHFVSELKGITPPLNNFKMMSMYRQMFTDYGVSTAMRADAVRKRVLQSEKLASKPHYRESSDGRYFVPNYKPVAARGPVAFPKVDDELKTLWVQHGEVRYLANAKVDVEDSGRVSLNSGEAVFSAHEPMSIRVNDCFVNIKDGAVVQVSVKKDMTIVRNLKEHTNNSVALKTKGRSIECAAGGELIIGSTMPTLFAEMKNDGLTRRNVHSMETESGSVVVNKSEIDLTSLLKYSPIMHKLYESKNEHDQKLIAQVVKMDAVLSAVTGGHGAYQRMAGMPNSH